MSCPECEISQNSDSSYWYRWKNANIELRGCKEHIKEIIDLLNFKQKK